MGNSTGADTLRALAARIATAVEQKLWAGVAQGGDHFITQLNPDGSTRDLVDYDANFIALAMGIPSEVPYSVPYSYSVLCPVRVLLGSNDKYKQLGSF